MSQHKTSHNTSIISKTKNCTIAKMTAGWALWVPLKFSELPDYAHGYFSQNFSRGFVLIDAMNVRTKFEVRSFTRSRVGAQEIGQSLDTPMLPFIQNF